MARGRTWVLMLSLGWTLACTGELFTEAEQPCCTVDDVLEMAEAEVDEATIITAIGASEQEVQLSAEDLIRLDEAEVSPAVVAALTGQPIPDLEAEEAEETEDTYQGPPPLRLSCSYTQGKSGFELFNHSTTTYTSIVLVANGEYEYQLKRLQGNRGDSIRLGSFVSTRDGSKLSRDIGITSLSVKARQGGWGQRF